MIHIARSIGCIVGTSKRYFVTKKTAQYGTKNESAVLLKLRNVKGRMRMNELRSCPFCGESNTVFVFDENELDQPRFPTSNPDFRVVCSVNEIETDTPNWKGGCGASGGYARTKEEAIAAWNRRTKE